MALRFAKKIHKNFLLLTYSIINFLLHYLKKVAVLLKYYLNRNKTLFE